MWRDGQAQVFEPKLQDVFSDPIVHLVMKRDGLTPELVLAEVMPVARLLVERRMPGAASGAA